MRCESCHGTGQGLSARQMSSAAPCEECGGTGIAHCCDGICVQPGPENSWDRVSETAASVEQQASPQAKRTAPR